MRIALTLDRDADLSESNDYLQSLVRAGIPRDAINSGSPPHDLTLAQQLIREPHVI